MFKKAQKPQKEFRTYATGDPVLGKVRGYPPWPDVSAVPCFPSWHNVLDAASAQAGLRDRLMSRVASVISAVDDKEWQSLCWRELFFAVPSVIFVSFLACEQQLYWVGNKKIENQLKRDRLMAKNEIKMLLGAGESGKSTVPKQMKLIHHGGCNDSERDSYKEIIFSNTIQSMRAILEAMPQLDLALEHQNDARRSIILSLPTQIEAETLPRDVGDAIRNFWRDPAVQEAIRRSREFQLNDSAVYYFNAIDRMSSPQYLPTDQDILRSRVKTTGITETTFKVGELTYKLFDVGGQRSERKKWIHCFENVTALVFLVSLSEYDQMLYEDESANRMQEALTLFDSVYNSRWFVKTSIILFLNKIDLFSEKLPRLPLEEYFPDYQGGDNYDAACDYLLHRFVSLNQSMATKQIHGHYTCTTDTQQIKCEFVFLVFGFSVSLIWDGFWLDF
ncbi:hypothetical protein D9613_000009 [Agrocybe pediades]|uniref:Uncharacterized protein n=1 Tax=Agrocybe pediades TaxID=84607 RepID=A0A8H4R1L7_9AGAR|nr:hypothetical protein D9613_000009 [Agrocybe pediades]